MKYKIKINENNLYWTMIVSLLSIAVLYIRTIVNANNIVFYYIFIIVVVLLIIYGLLSKIANNKCLLTKNYIIFYRGVIKEIKYKFINDESTLIKLYYSYSDVLKKDYCWLIKFEFIKDEKIKEFRLSPNVFSDNTKYEKFIDELKKYAYNLTHIQTKIPFLEKDNYTSEEDVRSFKLHKNKQNIFNKIISFIINVVITSLFLFIYAYIIYYVFTHNYNQHIFIDDLVLYILALYLSFEISLVFFAILFMPSKKTYYKYFLDYYVIVDNEKIKYRYFNNELTINKSDIDFIKYVYIKTDYDAFLGRKIIIRYNKQKILTIYDYQLGQDIEEFGNFLASLDYKITEETQTIVILGVKK